MCACEGRLPAMPAFDASRCSPAAPAPLPSCLASRLWAPVMSETNKHMVEPGRMAGHEKSLRTVSEAHSQAACIPLPDTIPAPRLAAPLNDLLSKLRPASPAATTWACPSGLMRMSASSCVPRRRCDGVHGAASREGARRIWPLPGVACLPCPHQLLQSATHPPNTLPLYLPLPQITAEEYRAAREELRSIDARPIKKVAEAKARKRKRLQMRLTQVRAAPGGSPRAGPAWRSTLLPRLLEYALCPVPGDGRRWVLSGQRPTARLPPLACLGCAAPAAGPPEGRERGQPGGRAAEAEDGGD